MLRFFFLFTLFLAVSAEEEKSEVALLQEQIANDFHIPLPHLIDSYGVFRKFKCALCKDIIRDKWTFVAGEIKGVDKLVHHILEDKEHKAQSFCSHIFLCPRHPNNSTSTTTAPPE